MNNRVKFKIALSLFLLYAVWNILYGMIFLLVFESQHVNLETCQIIDNSHGCTITVISKNNGSTWTVNPCPFEPSVYIDVCAVMNDKNVPLPYSYYSQKTSVFIYKIFDVVLFNIIIVVLIIAGLRVMMGANYENLR